MLSDPQTRKVHDAETKDSIDFDRVLVLLRTASRPLTLTLLRADARAAAARGGSVDGD